MIENLVPVIQSMPPEQLAMILRVGIFFIIGFVIIQVVIWKLRFQVRKILIISAIWLVSWAVSNGIILVN